MSANEIFEALEGHEQGNALFCDVATSSGEYFEAGLDADGRYPANDELRSC